MKSRRCRKCRRRKSLKYFNRKNICSYCEAKCNKRQKNIIDYIHNLKENGKCTFCNENTPCCLEFHHKDPNKKRFEISNIWKKTNSIKLIKEELDKCFIVCANCHKKIHNGIIVLEDKDESADSRI